MEQKEVERRMTAEGWYDGRQELLPDDAFDEDVDEEEDDDVFYDAQYNIAATRSRSSRPSSVRSGLVISDIDIANDDFQSCRASLNESLFGSDDQFNMESVDIVRNDSISIGHYGHFLSSPSSSAAAPSICAEDEEEKDEDGGSVIEEVQEVKEEIERANLTASARKLLSMGAHIKDTNVFALER